MRGKVREDSTGQWKASCAELRACVSSPSVLVREFIILQLILAPCAARCAWDDDDAGQEQGSHLRLECKYDRANDDGGLELGPCCFWSRLRSLPALLAFALLETWQGSYQSTVHRLFNRGQAYVSDGSHQTNQMLLAKSTFQHLYTHAQVHCPSHMPKHHII
jgi:hypothetical protein